MNKKLTAALEWCPCDSSDGPHPDCAVHGHARLHDEVHVAGWFDPVHGQRCTRCRVILTEPGLMPFMEGAHVQVVTGWAGRASVLVDDPPTCQPDADPA